MQHAHHMVFTSYPDYWNLMRPTELENLFAMMALPQDNSWYMDSDATTHMMNSSRTLLPIFNLNTHNHILVGNGDCILILGYSQSSCRTLTHHYIILS